MIFLDFRRKHQIYVYDLSQSLVSCVTWIPPTFCTKNRQDMAQMGFWAQIPKTGDWAPNDQILKFSINCDFTILCIIVSSFYVKI